MTPPTPEQLAAAAERWAAWRKWQAANYLPNNGGPYQTEPGYNVDDDVVFLPEHAADAERLADYALAVLAAGDETAKLREACEKLNEIDWILGYEVNDKNCFILDKAIYLARTALALAPGGEQ